MYCGCVQCSDISDEGSDSDSGSGSDGGSKKRSGSRKRMFNEFIEAEFRKRRRVREHVTVRWHGKYIYLLNIRSKPHLKPLRNQVRVSSQHVECAYSTVAGYVLIPINSGEDCKLKEASNFRRIPKLTLKVLYTILYGSTSPTDGHSSGWLVLVGS